MKLYYAPGACSLAPHIVALEAKLDIKLDKVQFGLKRLTEDGRDYYGVNSKGAVPALELDDGQVLTENAVVLQYLAARATAANLIPADGLARWRVLELLNYIATELHKGFAPLFNPAITPEAREATVKALGKKFDFLEKAIAGHSYLLGEQFTLADAYAYAVLNWTRPHKIDLTPWPNLTAFLARMEQRPAVKLARQQEGIG